MKRVITASNQPKTKHEYAHAIYNILKDSGKLAHGREARITEDTWVRELLSGKGYDHPYGKAELREWYEGLMK